MGYISLYINKLFKKQQALSELYIGILYILVHYIYLHEKNKKQRERRYISEKLLTLAIINKFNYIFILNYSQTYVGLYSYTFIVKYSQKDICKSLFICDFLFIIHFLNSLSKHLSHPLAYSLSDLSKLYIFLLFFFWFSFLFSFAFVACFAPWAG